MVAFASGKMIRSRLLIRTSLAGAGAFALVSGVTSFASLSARRPTKLAWRTAPPAVYSAKAISATRSGFTQWTLRAAALSKKIRAGLAELADRYDVIDRVTGQGLIIGVVFKTSDRLPLRIQQAVMGAADPGAFAAAVNVDLYKHGVLVPGYLRF